jgi:DNA-binding CsgD family transcriptional regulator
MPLQWVSHHDLTARAKACEVKSLKAQGIGPSEIARRLGIGRTSVHCILSAV